LSRCIPIYITTNEFCLFGSCFNASQIYAFPKSVWFIKTKRRRVFDAGGASLEGSALHGVVFDRYARPQKRAGEARLPGSGRESPSDPDSEGVRFGAGNC
jgi:hypothetical protein